MHTIVRFLEGIVHSSTMNQAAGFDCLRTIQSTKVAGFVSTETTENCMGGLVLCCKVTQERC